MTAKFKANKYLEDIAESGIGEDEVFDSDYVKEVLEASKTLFTDMSKMCGVTESQDILPSLLAKQSISKAQLSEWLFSTIYLLDRCCNPLLSYADRDVGVLKDEKIGEQKKIIDLQEQLIAKQEENLQSVKKTVETELRSYSSVVEKSCTEALKPQKLAAVVKTVTDKEDRSGNIVVFGLPEEENEVVEDKVIQILEQLQEKPRIMSCSRLGKQKPSAVRPVRFSVHNSATVFQILQKAKMLKDIDSYKSIYLCPDRTIGERETRRKLVEQLKQRRQNNQQKRYYIRKGEIICVD